jgi:hypothetical protein
VERRRMSRLHAFVTCYCVTLLSVASVAVAYFSH